MMTIPTLDTPLCLGETRIAPTIIDGFLQSLGSVQIGSTPVRNPATRFLPWFDTFAGDIFRQFEFLGVEQRGADALLATRAWSDPDTMFREQRDSSGDLCFRNVSWDAAPLSASLKIGFRPAQEVIDGQSFTGFTYWYEFASDDVAIHRLVDRQTWEIGGNLDDLSLCLRNWLTPPRMRIARETTYSTVGLDNWAALLPGNLWARWSLLPGFDMQYGKAGVLLGWFDEVSLIRTVVESNAGEDWLRVLDLHAFAQSKQVRTNPKTILWSPAVLDSVDALNLWTRLQDREADKSRRQFGIREESPPQIVFSENVWRGFRFDTTYEHTVAVAAEFGADYVFIDSIFEHQQAFSETLESLIPKETWKGTILEKFNLQPNMCITLDFEVAQIHGGEAGLKALCDRAAAKGLKVISWMAAHLSPNSAIAQRPELGAGTGGIFAARESGRHPDTGAPQCCWTLNLNAPIHAKLREQLLGVCERTGLGGYLWDSVSNMGWWQLDYSTGSMRPQFDKMGVLYADLVNEGLCILSEAIATFSNHSCCGLHGGNVYAGDLLGYSYNTMIGLWFGGGEPIDNLDCQILRGEQPLDTLFQYIAHKRMPSLSFHLVPREKWHAPTVAQLKELLAVYKSHRQWMQKRIVLKNDAGVLWESEHGPRLLFSFRHQPTREPWVDASTRRPPEDAQLQPNRVYRQDACCSFRS